MSDETKQVVGFFLTAKRGKQIPVAVPGKIMSAPISTTEGTFLARSSSKRARALAAVMVLHDAHKAAARR